MRRARAENKRAQASLFLQNSATDQHDCFFMNAERVPDEILFIFSKTAPIRLTVPKRAH
jgi:hypothetical protein